MKIIIDPFTRLTSGFRVTVDLKDGAVSDAHSSGMAYRGFEQMLLGKDPMDAPYYTQRVCGMCSSSHATASANAIESACGATHLIPKDALVVRNILNGLGWIKNHIEHMYMGFMPDLTDTTYREALKTSDLGNLLWAELDKRYNAPGGEAYLDTLRCIKLIGRAEGILGGRSPGSPVIVPGGVTTRPTESDVYELKRCMDGINTYLQGRLLGTLSIDDWLRKTHDSASQDYAFNYLAQLPMGDLSTTNGWGDLHLFMLFCSRMVSRDMMTLPAYIAFDSMGGYPLNDQLIGFLSYGSFYKVKNAAGQYTDGYSPIEDEKPGSYEMQAGFTPGSLQSLSSPADPMDPNLIVEHVYGSFFDYTDSKTSIAPLNGETSPLTAADDIGYDGIKYSFIKAPRYGRVPCETGPLARLINTRENFIVNVMQKLYQRNNSSYDSYVMASVYTRMLARMQETLLISRMLDGWISDDLGVSTNGRKYSIPLTVAPDRTGSGLIEAPRGALGHWLKVDPTGKISNYQIVAPTTWNASPRCSELKQGPIELALMGGQTTPAGYLPGSESNPVGLYHIVRSFDPCIACAVHTIRR